MPGMKYYKDGGQALFDALKKKGYKRDGGSTMAKPALESSMNGVVMKHGGSCGKVRKASYYRKGKK